MRQHNKNALTRTAILIGASNPTTKQIEGYAGSITRLLPSVKRGMREMQTIETEHLEGCPACGGSVDKGEVFADLMHLAVSKGITVRFVPFQFCNGRMKGDRIGIRQSLPTIEDINYILAHAIAHVYLQKPTNVIIVNIFHQGLVAREYRRSNEGKF